MAALSGLTFLLVLAVFVVLFLSKESQQWFDPLVPVAFIALGVSSAAGGFLWLWRRCDRCQRRLFSNASDGIYIPASERHNASRLGNWLTGAVTPERHFRARKFLNSYRDKAILDYVRRGQTRCQWCNHEDGARPNDLVAPGDQ